MCVGIPVLLTACDGLRGEGLDVGLDDGRPVLVDLSLTPEARPGDWALTFLGAAREIIDADRAEKIVAALAGLRAIMSGGEAGDAFADLEAREPALPPHLAAAQAAGRTVA